MPAVRSTPPNLNGVVLETLTKIPLQDRATNPGELQKVEGAMDRRQLVIPDFQPTGLPDPRQGPLDHVADLAQAAAMWCPLARQMVLDASLLDVSLWDLKSLAFRRQLPVRRTRLGIEQAVARRGS